MEKNLQKSKILEGCKKNDRDSQELLYKAYYPVCLDLVKENISEPDNAINCLNQGFLSLFKNIASYNYNEPFEDWLLGFIKKAIEINKIP